MIALDKQAHFLAGAVITLAVGYVAPVLVAFIAALLFAVHPIHTEVVSNIKSLDEIFCFMFAFLSLNVFVGYMKTGKAWQLLVGMLAMFLSFLSKETVVTFLGIIPLVFFFYITQDKPEAKEEDGYQPNILARITQFIKENVISKDIKEQLLVTDKRMAQEISSKMGL
jgi:chromate transport protein ChrA